MTTANFEPIWGFVWPDFWSPNGFFLSMWIASDGGLLAGATDACGWVWLLCESCSVGGDVTRVESESAFRSVVLFVDPSFESAFAFLLSGVPACVLTWPHVTRFVKLGLRNTAASHWPA